MAMIRKDIELSEWLLHQVRTTDGLQEFSQYLSNAGIDGSYCLRTCIVHFRTTQNDLEALVQTVLEEGMKIHYQLNPILY